jgi:hypothetical protein
MATILSINQTTFLNDDEYSQIDNPHPAIGKQCKRSSIIQERCQS